jgi:hypothetical protein
MEIDSLPIDAFTLSGNVLRAPENDPIQFPTIIVYAE